MTIGKGRLVNRLAIVFAVIMVGVGATLWLWPKPTVTDQAGPELATVSIAAIPPGSIRSTAAPVTIPTGSRDPISSARRSGPSPGPSRAGASATSGADPRVARTTVGSRATRSALTVKPTAKQPSGGQVEPTTTSATPATSDTFAASDPPAPPVPTPTSNPAAGPARVPDGTPQGPSAVPATIDIPFSSTNHPDGVTMTVMPHGPAANGEVWIPGPEEGIDNWARAVSWLNSEGFAAPFSTHGAVIIAGHINWKGTAGALSDLSEYGRDDIGKTLTVTMTDGRVRTYRTVESLTIDKAQLAAESNQGRLHTAMFGQIQTYGQPGRPTEELRLISCGGEYDAAAASYNSNVIIFARPIS